MRAFWSEEKARYRIAPPTVDHVASPISVRKACPRASHPSGGSSRGQWWDNTRKYVVTFDSEKEPFLRRRVGSICIVGVTAAHQQEPSEKEGGLENRTTQKDISHCNFLWGHFDPRPSCNAILQSCQLPSLVRRDKAIAN